MEFYLREAAIEVVILDGGNCIDSFLILCIAVSVSRAPESSGR